MPVAPGARVDRFEVFFDLVFVFSFFIITRATAMDLNGTNLLHALALPNLARLLGASVERPEHACDGKEVDEFPPLDHRSLVVAENDTRLRISFFMEVVGTDPCRPHPTL